jgi:glycosyltransferase involved in cell wall biosynthesis
VVRALEHQPGRRTRSRVIEGLLHLTSPVPQNAVPRVLDTFRPDVVIGNSLVRLSWRRVRAECAARGIPTVLYVREVASLDHLLPDELADATVANASSLVAAVERRGPRCSYVPSVIEVEPTRTTTTRRVALMVNPIASHGVVLTLQLAARLPEIPFVLQESWPLAPDHLEELERRCAALPNVELRRALPPGPLLYRDARVLLVPHMIDNRPRVIAEAQANGIPVIASQFPGLVEAIGGGGLTVDGADAGGWCAEIRDLWHDHERYERLAEAAVVHSRRAEIDPAAVTASFEEILVGLTERAPPGRG